MANGARNGMVAHVEQAPKRQRTANAALLVGNLKHQCACACSLQTIAVQPLDMHGWCVDRHTCHKRVQAVDSGWWCHKDCCNDVLTGCVACE